MLPVHRSMNNRLREWNRRFLRPLPFVGLILAVVLRLALTPALAVDTDPVEAALRAYMESETQLRSRQMTKDQKMQWRQEWLQRLLAVAGENPKSAHRPRALRTASRLANSAGNYALSQSIIRQILETVWDDLPQQIEWLTELGEVTRLEFRQNRSDESRKSAIKAFEDANARIEDGLKAMPQGKEAMTEQLILNLAWIGELQGDRSATKDELRSAAQAYRKARLLLQVYGQPQGRLMGLGYDPECLAEHEAISATRGGDLDASQSALDVLLALPNKKWPTSMYVKRCAEGAFAIYGKEYQDFIENWLKNAPEDEYTAVLKCQVAESYMRSKAYEKAAAIYEELNTKYVDALLKIDKDAIRQGRGGYYADVLYSLRVFYVNRKEYAKAAVVNRRFLELFPNYDEMTKNAKGMQPWLEGQIEKANRKTEMDGG